MLDSVHRPVSIFFCLASGAGQELYCEVLEAGNNNMRELRVNQNRSAEGCKIKNNELKVAERLRRAESVGSSQWRQDIKY